MSDLSSGGVVKPDRERIKLLLRSRPLTVSMSRSRLFLGGLLSSRARLRFTSRIHFQLHRLEM
jgi:hypothetical protein